MESKEINGSDSSPAPKRKRINSKKRCAVFNCWSPLDASFHSFPSEPFLRKKWAEFCLRDDDFNLDTSFICGHHFSESSFETSSLRLQLMPEAKLRRNLKSGSLPTINVSEGEESKKSSRTIKAEKKERQDLVNELLESPPAPSVICRRVKDLKAELKEYGLPVHGTKMDLKNRLDKYKEEMANSKVKTSPKHCESNLEDTVREKASEKCVNQECEKEVLKYKNQIRKLKKIIKSMKKSKQSRIATVKEVLHEKGHNKTKVNFLMGKTLRPGNFCKEEITDGVILKTLSLRAYKFLRDRKLLCLPAPCTLSRWTRDSKVDVGFLSSGLEIMKKNVLANNDTKNFDLTVLSFDEVKISETVESSNSQSNSNINHSPVLGPFKKLQVLYAQGLIHPWKQPIFLGFDQPMTKEILLDGVMEIEKNGGKVIQIVCDRGATNQRLWTELGISKESPYFTHPANFSRKIFCKVTKENVLPRDPLLIFE